MLAIYLFTPIMNLHIETLIWLNKQIEKIHNESVKTGELLLGAIDKLSAELYSQKLLKLEKEHETITRKIWKEKEIIESGNE